MDLKNFQKISAIKKHFNLSEYSKDVENIFNIFVNFNEISLGEDDGEKYVEFKIQKPLENPFYIIKYESDFQK